MNTFCSFNFISIWSGNKSIAKRFLPPWEISYKSKIVDRLPFRNPISSLGHRLGCLKLKWPPLAFQRILFNVFGGGKKHDKKHLLDGKVFRKKKIIAIKTLGKNQLMFLYAIGILA